MTHRTLPFARRTLLGAAASLGLPAVLRAQPAAVKLGILQPMTGVADQIVQRGLSNTFRFALGFGSPSRSWCSAEASGSSASYPGAAVPAHQAVRSQGVSTRDLLPILGLAALLALAPFFASDAMLNFLVSTLIVALAVQGWNLLGGFGFLPPTAGRVRFELQDITQEAPHLRAPRHRPHLPDRAALRRADRA